MKNIKFMLCVLAMCALLNACGGGGGEVTAVKIQETKSTVEIYTGCAWLEQAADLASEIIHT